jgi:hypothetical protein
MLNGSKIQKTRKTHVPIVNPRVDAKVKVGDKRYAREKRIPPLFVLLCLLTTTTKAQLNDEDYP